MPKTNIEYLRELLTTEEQGEFLDAIENDISHMKSTIRDLQEDDEHNRDEINDLERCISRLEEKSESGNRIGTPLGTIRYETEGSLTLQQIMEALAEAIKEEGATAVLRHLEETYAV